MNEFKNTVAANIAKLRTARGFTQAQLGEYLSYSDKSISKWERGDSLPDAFVLKQMSELFNVSVDYILEEHGNELPPEVRKHRYSRRVITMISFVGIWTLSLAIFVLFWMFQIVIPLILVYTIPIALVDLLVCNSVWGTKKNNIYIISGLVWSVLATIYLTFLAFNWWQLFILGLPAQFVIFLAFKVKMPYSTNRRAKKTNQ